MFMKSFSILVRFAFVQRLYSVSKDFFCYSVFSNRYFYEFNSILGIVFIRRNQIKQRELIRTNLRTKFLPEKTFVT